MKEINNSDTSLGMKELVRASGAHRQTIHAYLRDGVLPPPSESAGTRNARYSQRHLSLLLLLRELREEHGLSVPAIQRLFAQAGFDPAAARLLLQGGPPASLSLTSPTGRPLEPPATEHVTPDELCARADAPAPLLRRLVAAGVLAPDPDDAAQRFLADAAPVLSGAQRLREQQLSEEAVVQLLQHAGAIAAVEVAALLDEASGLLEGDEPLVRRAEGRHRHVTELLAAVRWGALRDALRRLAGVGPRAQRFAADAIYVPSPLFVRRHRLEPLRAEAEAQARRDDSGQAGLRLGRLLVGLGRYDEAAEWLGRSAAQAPGDAEIQAYLGLSRAIAGRVAAGVQSCRQAVALAPQSPRCLAFLSTALAVQAALTSGLDDPAAVLGHALHMAEESRRLPEADLRERLEVLTSRGRVCMVLPVGSAGQRAGVADLEEVLARTRPGAALAQVEAASLDVPGTSELYRMNALYFLGMRDGPYEEVAAQLRECITLDPQSRFAHSAYERLAELRPPGGAP